MVNTNKRIARYVWYSPNFIMPTFIETPPREKSQTLSQT